MSKEIDFSSEMQELANVIAQYAPENWEKMITSFEPYGPADYGIDSCAIVGNEKVPVDFDEEDIDRLEKTFMAIQAKSVEHWRVAQFEFSSEGDCELNFEY